MCGSMADIQSPTAEIRRGKKRKKIDRKKLQDEYIWSALLHRATIKYTTITIKPRKHEDIKE